MKLISHSPHPCPPHLHPFYLSYLKVGVDTIHFSLSLTERNIVELISSDSTDVLHEQDDFSNVTASV